MPPWHCFPAKMKCQCENGDGKACAVGVAQAEGHDMWEHGENKKLSSCFAVCGGKTCVSGIQSHLDNNAIAQNCGALDFLFVANHLPGCVGRRSGTEL